MLKEDQLIFLISQPRSGSTLLQSILSNHPKIDTTSEHWLLLPFLSLRSPELSNAVYNQPLAMDAINDFLTKYDVEDKLWAGLKTLLLTLYQKIQLDPTHHILDKTPRYYEIVEHIHDIFPKAKIVVLKRHPLAVMNSIIKTWNRSKFSDLARHHHRDLFYGPFKLLEIEKKYINHSHFKFLTYEEFLENPDKTYNDLINWIGYEQHTFKFKINENVKGKYGDPTGIHEFERLEVSRSDSWLESIKSKRIGKLLQGYSAFLGKKFFNKYGYSPLSFSPTFQFKLFYYYSHYLNEPSRYPVKGFFAFFLSKLFNWG